MIDNRPYIKRIAKEMFERDYYFSYARVIYNQSTPLDIYTAQEEYLKLSQLPPMPEEQQKQPLPNKLLTKLNFKLNDQTMHNNGATAREYEFLLGLMSNLGVVMLAEDFTNPNGSRYVGIKLSPDEIYNKYYEQEYTKKAEAFVSKHYKQAMQSEPEC